MGLTTRQEKYIRKILVAVCTVMISLPLFSQQKSNCLQLVEDRVSNETGYRAANGKMEVPFGKYPQCFTKTFCRFAIVATSDGRIVGINRNEEILFDIFLFDNGPDPVRDGLFRIIKNGKIGYADVYGNIVIAPQYDCAEPFSKGKARVGLGCKTETTGEHTSWTGGKWFLVNRKGKRI